MYNVTFKLNAHNIVASISKLLHNMLHGNHVAMKNASSCYIKQQKSHDNNSRWHPNEIPTKRIFSGFCEIRCCLRSFVVGVSCLADINRQDPQVGFNYVEARFFNSPTLNMLSVIAGLIDWMIADFIIF